jgi:hypothetical protein
MTRAFHRRHPFRTAALSVRIALASIVAACVLLGASPLVLAGQQTKYGVSVKASKPAALAKAKTYVWTKSQPSFDKDVDRQITAAVDRELAARGFTKLPSGTGDVVVTYASIGRTDVDLKSKPAEDGTRRQYAVGTLVVDMRDPANKASLFRVRMDTPIDKDPAKLEAAINAAVAAMFEKYPKPPAS